MSPTHIEISSHGKEIVSFGITGSSRFLWVGVSFFLVVVVLVVVDIFVGLVWLRWAGLGWDGMEWVR